MFRIVLEIKDVNYDRMLDAFFEQMKANKNNNKFGEFKLPPIPNLDFMKNMPQDTKNGMVASAINAEQKRIIDMVEMLTIRLGYPAKIHKVGVACLNEPEITVRVVIDVESMQFKPAIEKICMQLIEEKDLNSCMGKAYRPGITLQEVPAYMETQDEKKQEFFVLKSMSDKKQFIMRKIEEMASEKDMMLRLSNMRFMVQ